MNHEFDSESNSSKDGAASMVMRLREDDPDAWRDLVELFGPLIFEWCKICHLDSADSADVMQEVLSSVSKKIHSFHRRPGASFRGWLWTITQNKIRDHFRKIEKAGMAAGGTDAHMRLNSLPADLGLAEDPTTADANNHLLRRAMDQIQPEFTNKSWTAFWRSVVEGDQTQDIAADLGISTTGVRQAKRRILRRLRQQLGDLD